MKPSIGPPGDVVLLRRPGSADIRRMSVSAVGSGLAGLAAAQSMFDASARAAARVSAADSGSDDVAGGVAGMSVASAAVQVNIAVLKTALDNERSIVDLLA